MIKEKDGERRNRNMERFGLFSLRTVTGGENRLGDGLCCTFF